MILETYDKELHDKTLRREGYEDGYNKGINDGIRQLISTLQEINFSGKTLCSNFRKSMSFHRKKRKNIWLNTGKNEDCFSDIFHQKRTAAEVSDSSPCHVHILSLRLLISSSAKYSSACRVQ